MLLIALVIVRKNPFEPLVHQRLLVRDHELFAATITPKGAHFLESSRFFLRLTLLYRNCTHVSMGREPSQTDSPVGGRAIVLRKVLSQMRGVIVNWKQPTREIDTAPVAVLATI
jgi:hypothetical protein